MGLLGYYYPSSTSAANTQQTQLHDDDESAVTEGNHPLLDDGTRSVSFVRLLAFPLQSETQRLRNDDEEEEEEPDVVRINNTELRD